VSASYVPDELVEEIAQLYGDEVEGQYFRRMWSGDRGRYEQRIRALGFTDLPRVLDCGFGTGQWLLPFARLNGAVSGIEYNEKRVRLARMLVEKLGLTNVDLERGQVEKLPYEDRSFDAVFCNGVLFLADFRAGLRELHRVLKPGGRLYFTAVGVGWFLYLLIEEHNKMPGYDPRGVGADALARSIFYASETEGGPANAQLCVPSAMAAGWLRALGFDRIEIGADGTLGDGPPTSFYPRTEYLGHEFVYEVLAVKNK
jgi:SAM-dependent methyltransferase